MLKSVLRYPGGKSKSAQKLVSLIPPTIKEFREPMMGGGSVSLVLKQTLPHVKVWINDLDYDLVCFWKTLRDNPEELIKELKRIKALYKDGRRLFEEFSSKEDGDEFERAVRFFVLNRISFSGTTYSGGYSQQAFERRFTDSSIERLRKASEIIKDFRITHGDYERLLFEEGEDVFIFLDPPYYSTTSSKLYGKRGHLHTSFDHKRFTENMQKYPHLWLITYDDCEEVRNLFSFAYIYSWELQYGMSAKKGQRTFDFKLFTQRKGLAFEFVLGKV
jgi:DNA adenine methylase